MDLSAGAYHGEVGKVKFPSLLQDKWYVSQVVKEFLRVLLTLTSYAS